MGLAHAGRGFLLPRRGGMLACMIDLHNLSTFSGIPPERFADAVFNRYAERLIAVARERLGAQLRSKVSPEDVVQSAFKSFFRRQGEFQFSSDGSDGLWGLLVVITVRKCTKWVDVFGALKRSTGREVPLNAESPDGSPWREAASREPGPEDAALLSELVERLLARFRPREQQMISLRMQGYELAEIAEQVQSSRRTVARVIRDAKDVIQQLVTEED